jgi:lactoylglutathione lyase
MTTDVASIVLFAADADRTAEFYRAVGVDLADERHDEGPLHYAVEVGGVHVAVYAAAADGVAPKRRHAGDTFVGFYVDSLDDAESTLQGLGAKQVADHESMPWGCRVLFEDPDGRTVEINDRAHCAQS